MSVLTPLMPSPQSGGNRLSVAEYHRMLDVGILQEGERIELLEGCLVPRMTQKPPHASALQLTRKPIEARLPTGWTARIQLPVTLTDSEPEPDIAVVRGADRDFLTRHPGPADVGLVVEVSETTLDSDRDQKVRIYARANIPEYWIVNLVDNQVEIYTQPSGPTANPGYAQCRIFAPTDQLSFALDGTLLGHILVAEMLP